MNAVLEQRLRAALAKANDRVEELEAQIAAQAHAPTKTKPKAPKKES